MGICKYAYNCKTKRHSCMYCRDYNYYNPIDKAIKTDRMLEAEQKKIESKKNKSEASKQSKRNVKAGRKSEERGVKAIRDVGIDSDQVFMSGAGYEKGDFTISDRFLVENKREKGFNKMYNYLDKIKHQAKPTGRYPLLRIDTKGKYPVYCVPEYIMKMLMKEIGA